MSSLWIITAVIVIKIVSRSVAKHRCRKQGHIWSQRSTRLKCSRCGKKSAVVTRIQPESRVL